MNVKRLAATTVLTLGLAAGLATTAAPAQAGVGGCSSLAADGVYIVGSCTANYPSATATITVAHSCAGLKAGSVIYKKITVGYGSSFRVKSSCWTWVTNPTRVG